MSEAPLHGVVETPDYLSDAKQAGLSEEERDYVVRTIAADPECGDRIRGTGGARKVRFAGRSNGKSGGYRVITYFGGDDIPVFLLNVFSKGERSDLSQADRNEMKKELAGLARDYRESMKR